GQAQLRRDREAVAGIAQPGPRDRGVDREEERVVARPRGALDQAEGDLPLVHHVQLEPVPPQRVRGLHVLDRGGAERREGEGDARGPGGAGPGDLALGLHQAREARRRDAEGEGGAAAEDLRGGVHMGDVVQDRGVELDVLEGLDGAAHGDLSLGGAVGVVEGRGGRASLRDPPQVLDRERGGQAAPLGVEVDPLELHELEDLGGPGDLTLDHGSSFVSGGRAERAGSGQGAGIIQDSTEDCIPTSRHSATSMPRLHQMTRRKMADSWPTRPTAVAAMVRFWGLIILPTTPPEVFAATSSAGSRPAFSAAVCWSVANRASALVSGPVTAVPSQPRIGERNAKAAPVPAIQVPMVIVWPDWFMT